MQGVKGSWPCWPRDTQHIHTRCPLYGIVQAKLLHHHSSFVFVHLSGRLDGSERSLFALGKKKNCDRGTGSAICFPFGRIPTGRKPFSPRGSLLFRHMPSRSWGICTVVCILGEKYYLPSQAHFSSRVRYRLFPMHAQERRHTRGIPRGGFAWAQKKINRTHSCSIPRRPLPSPRSHSQTTLLCCTIYRLAYCTTAVPVYRLFRL